MDEQRKWLLESTGEDSVKIVEMSRKSVEYFILVDKAVGVSERID